jgi:hypothetical protein
MTLRSHERANPHSFGCAQLQRTSGMRYEVVRLDGCVENVADDILPRPQLRGGNGVAEPLGELDRSHRVGARRDHGELPLPHSADRVRAPSAGLKRTTDELQQLDGGFALEVGSEHHTGRRRVVVGGLGDQLARPVHQAPRPDSGSSRVAQLEAVAIGESGVEQDHVRSHVSRPFKHRAPAYTRSTE